MCERRGRQWRLRRDRTEGEGFLGGNETGLLQQKNNNEHKNTLRGLYSSCLGGPDSLPRSSLLAKRDQSQITTCLILISCPGARTTPCRHTLLSNWTSSSAELHVVLQFPSNTRRLLNTSHWATEDQFSNSHRGSVSLHQSHILCCAACNSDVEKICFNKVQRGNWEVNSQRGAGRGSPAALWLNTAHTATESVAALGFTLRLIVMIHVQRSERGFGGRTMNKRWKNNYKLRRFCAAAF